MRPTMTQPFISRAAVISAVCAATAVVALTVWTLAYRSALDQASERGHADLALAADRLTGQLQRYRELAVLLSDHPVLINLIKTGEGAQAATDLLVGMADKTGSAALELVGADGKILVSGLSLPLPSEGEVAPTDDLSRAARTAFARSMNGALGVAHYLSPDGNRRFTFAAPVFSEEGPAQGAVLAQVDIATIEWNWPSDPSAVFFTDPDGIVFITNRSDLILTQRGLDFPTYEIRDVAGYETWRGDGGPYLPGFAMHLERDLPVVGLAGELLLDLSPARELAALQAAVAAALCLMFGAFLILATERRRTLATANAKLEARVAERTAELEEANTELRHEIHERKEAEARLKQAQADLVQAGKLSALGQMSAGISHELNQPLTAIRSFAENAELFLDRGKPEMAAENLSRISDLARRMGRIIQNLRAFARQEKETISDVDLVGVVEAVLDMAGGTISKVGAKVDWTAPPLPVFVRGGDVRLQQVLMNLISNAVDAVSESEDKRLQIMIQLDGSRVRLIVRDSGSGIADPSKIFDPFYSTKEVGASEGMGLGLSISYGLVQSFGGTIRGANCSGGGAEFTVELNAARSAEAA